jgi:hypothetical protein
MIAADIAPALGDARRESRGWRCRRPLHDGRSLILKDGNGGRVLPSKPDTDFNDVLTAAPSVTAEARHVA